MIKIKQSDAEKLQEAREEALREKYRDWKPQPVEDREKFRRVLSLCVSGGE